MRFRVLDIETVPDLTVWTPSPSKWSWRMSGEPLIYGRAGEVVDVPGYKVRSPELFQEEPFPPPHAQRVVSISWVDVVLDIEKSPRYRFDSMHTSCKWSSPRDLRLDAQLERELLQAFADAAAAAEAASDILCFVTWNGRTFDLPVLAMRSLKHGISCPWYYAQKDVRYRYSTEGHLDLMDFYCDYGASAKMKLNDAVRLIGLPGKLDMTGASVKDEYEKTLAADAGPVFCDVVRSNVARYCLQDSLQTAVYFLRSRHHLGKIDADEYHRCLDTFARDPNVNAVMFNKIDWQAVRIPAAEPVGEVGGERAVRLV